MKRFQHIGTSGFSLVEILVSLGIVGVISLFTGQLMNTSKKFNRFDQSLNEIENLVNSMYHQAQILEVCENNFPAGTSITNFTPHTVFIDADNNPIFSSGALGINSTITAFEYDIGYSNADKDQVLLTLTFTTGNDVTGPSTLVRSFPLFVTYNTTTDTIAGCISMEDNYKKTVFDQTCLGTGAVADTTNLTCYHTGLQTETCSADKFVSGFAESKPDRLYVYYPTYCSDKTGLTVIADCGDKKLLMGFDGTGSPTCLPMTSTQLFPGFEQTAEACAGSILTLSRNPADGPVDIECGGAAVPTPVPTVSACSMANYSYSAPLPPTELFGDANWNLYTINPLTTSGFTGIRPLGIPFAPYLIHANDVHGYGWSVPVVNKIFPEVYSFNLDTDLGLGNFDIDSNTVGNTYKFSYYFRAISSQNTDPAMMSPAYGTMTCKFTFERTALNTYTYQIEAESCDPEAGVHPTASTGPTAFTHTAGGTSINLATRFLIDPAATPACGISIVQLPCVMPSGVNWPEECGASGAPDYNWNWLTLAQPNESFNAPNIWQRSIEIEGGDMGYIGNGVYETINVLDDYKICDDADPITGASVKCDM
jgi:prepilin-type N-terminal cleavage/methylation domain-containing protein